MSPSEFFDRYDNSPAIDESIFDMDSDSDDDVPKLTVEERMLQKLRKREARWIRMRFLYEYEECQKNGLDQSMAYTTYTSISSPRATLAHLKALDLAVETQWWFAIPTTTTTTEWKKKKEDISFHHHNHCHTLANISPCPPLKRRRVTV